MPLRWWPCWGRRACRVFGASAGDARIVGGGGAGGPAAVSSWRCTGGLVVGVGAFAGGCGGDRAGAGCEAGGVIFWQKTHGPQADGGG